ncbi:serine hydrolase domain-containing protein [Alkalihalophilus lindianensis]|uniref:Serine hydrolase domain-containing protein n=1 Tax=Alkalihalophilus lindianensis TaxID=1630542 RepID=A0ABU3XCP3_9BACI|nr:serine hydrolase domain-containing protein [Alkalihalophilus lindianensis]MDV2685654.1 serine hydrolase domain-containing protein [Alkalihalophilus lindianensis]
MNNHDCKVFKSFICFLLLWILFGYHPPSTFSANEPIFSENKVEDYLKEHKKEIAGLAAIVIDEDEVIYKMEGYADREKEILIKEDTVFEWGSVSKVLIWISVLQLVEEGRLDLETDIETYLPNDFRSKKTFEDPITMRHLMNHTAGFDDSYTDLMIHRSTEKYILREVLEEADIKQRFPPGDIVAYSNYGSGLAAYIVEEVSGLDYREYVRKNIFEPLHMTKTSIDPYLDDNKWVREQRGKVQGYSNGMQLIEPNFYSIPMYPIGSAMGTATDLQKVLQALLAEDGALLFNEKNTIDSMFEPTLYYPETTIPRVANGLFYLPSKSQHVYGHGGNSKAFSSSIYVDRKEGIGVIVLTNMKDESTFTSGIPEIIFGEYEHVKKDVKLENSSQWSGMYEPARLPSSGFSKVYGLLLRGKTAQSGSHHVIMNDFHYSQLEPGIYKTEDGSSLYSLDVYSKHPQLKNVLSNTYSDLLYVPYYKHLIEWGGMILAVVAILFSFIYVIVTSLRRIWTKKHLHLFLFSQHVLNLLMVMNVLWIGYQTVSMVSYATLKPLLTFNLIYVIIALVNSGFLSVKIKKQRLGTREKRIWMMTIVFTVILCANILYWEFYY